MCELPKLIVHWTRISMYIGYWTLNNYYYWVKQFWRTGTSPKNQVVACWFVLTLFSHMKVSDTKIRSGCSLFHLALLNDLDRFVLWINMRLHEYAHCSIAFLLASVVGYPYVVLWLLKSPITIWGRIPCPSAGSRLSSDPTCSYFSSKFLVFPTFCFCFKIPWITVIKYVYYLCYYKGQYFCMIYLQICDTIWSHHIKCTP